MVNLTIIINHIVLWTLIQNVLIIVAIRPINQKNNVNSNINAKQSFLSELKIIKNNKNYIQTERISNPNIKLMDKLVDETIQSNSNILNKSSSKNNSNNNNNNSISLFNKNKNENAYKPKGIWNIVFAPHITKLSNLFLTEFDVYYIFDDDNDNGNKLSTIIKNNLPTKTSSSSSSSDRDSENINITSSVKYKSKLFGQGWLNTKGILRYIDNNTKCQIIWENIWWDLNDKKPTSVTDTKNHIFPNLIQKIGLLFFIEAVSVFPINYIDDDLCIFLFSFSGTRICSIKKPNSAILPESYLS